MSKKQMQPVSTMKKSTKIAIAATALLLLAALIFGIVWTSLDHSYRYDREDLSVFFKNGATIDYNELPNLAIKLETGVSEDDLLTEIFTAVKNYSAVDRLKNHAANIRTDLPYNDIAYVYYEIYQWKDADKNDILDDDATLLIKNTAYGDASKATMVRLGSGSLHSMIEQYMMEHPEYSTAVTRVEDEGELLANYAGYTYVIDLKGTYVETTEKNGETTTTTKDYITLTDFNLQLNALPEGKSYYSGATTLKDQATKVKDHKISDEVSTAILDKFRAIAEVGGDFNDLKLDILLSTSDSETTEVTFTGSVKRAFLAETKGQTFKLDSDDNPDRTEFKYKDSAGSEQKIAISETLYLKMTVESTISLDQRTVEYLADPTDEDNKFKDFVKPTELGENPDYAYAAEFMKYVKEKLMKESEADIRKEAATFEASVRNALWEAVTEKYATADYIVSFPTSVVEDYVDLLYQSYLAEYQSSSLTTYDSAAEYILVKIYEVEGAEKLSAEEQQSALDRHLTEEAEEAIRKEIILFEIAKHFGVEYTSKAMNAAEDEIYRGLYASYVSYYTSLFGNQKDSAGSYLYSAADIARMAREEARAQSDAVCTPSYLREYVAIRAVQEKLVPDATAFTNITWVLKGELSK